MDEVWPNGARSAVSLTFDDGLEDQRTLAAPAMTERDLFGTFYLDTRGDWQTRLAPWRQAHREGHELGNHSHTHPCSENFQFVPDGRGLESLTLADLEQDLLTAERCLVELFGPVPRRSFAYPCYMTHVGRGLQRQTYVPVVAKHFVCGRGGGEYGFFNHPWHVDLACVYGQSCQHLTWLHMLGLVEACITAGQWLILVFHSLGIGHLATPLADFLRLCDHLASRRDAVWVAPVAEVAHHLQQARAARLIDHQP